LAGTRNPCSKNFSVWTALKSHSFPLSRQSEVAIAPLPAASLPLRNVGGPTLDLLNGIVVLDMTTSIAGPYAGLLLADLGATVIKIEKPRGGDDCRAWGPPFLDGESLWYLSANRNKHSVTLDFATDEGRAILAELVAKADIAIVNLVARAQQKLGVSGEQLCKIRSDLIHVSITGFGLEGSRADTPCYDLIAEGYSGVMDLTGEPDDGPQKVGTPAADLLAGEDAALAALAALFRRERTGRGATIDVSMMESMTRFMAPRLLPYLGSGDVPTRSGGRDSVIAIYQAFDTADNPLTLALGNDAIWRRFWDAVGYSERAEDPTRSDNAKRRQKRSEIMREIAALLKTRSRDDWLKLFSDARVPAGPINRIDEVAADLELQRREFLYRFERNGHSVPQVGLGIGFDGATSGLDRAPPRLGEDNAAIFGTWLGMDSERLAQLAGAGII
jgi:crotonobetainyl-CoA:carnitine CoA-transferase CaiB-like acyl-CoA transferase